MYDGWRGGGDATPNGQAGMHVTANVEKTSRRLIKTCTQVRLRKQEWISIRMDPVMRLPFYHAQLHIDAYTLLNGAATALSVCTVQCERPNMWCDRLWEAT